MFNMVFYDIQYAQKMRKIHLDGYQIPNQKCLNIRDNLMFARFAVKD